MSDSTCKVSSSSVSRPPRPAGKLVHTSKKSQVSLLTRAPGNLGQRQAFGEHRRIWTGTRLHSSFRDWIPKAPETAISGSLATSSARIQHQKVPRFCRINTLKKAFSLDALLDGVAGGGDRCPMRNTISFKYPTNDRNQTPSGHI